MLLDLGINSARARVSAWRGARRSGLLCATSLTALCFSLGIGHAQTVLPAGAGQVVLSTYPSGNPFTLNSGTTIAGGASPALIFGDATQAWILNTNGLINNTASGAGNGVQFDNGGTIDNGATNAGARINGYDNGILLQGTNPSTVINGGIINGGSTTFGAAVNFKYGGTLTNKLGGTIASVTNGTPTVRFDGAMGSADNSGTITGAPSGYGFYIVQSANIINRATGVIQAGASTISGSGIVLSGASLAPSKTSARSPGPQVSSAAG